MNIAITTATQIRHKYMVNLLDRHLGYALKVVVAQRSREPSETDASAPQNKKHLFERLFEKIIKIVLFRPSSLHFRPKEKIVYVDSVNDDIVKRTLQERQIDLLIIFGGKIIKDEILAAVKYRAINIHNGYSPYYKGSYTIFFPIAEHTFDKVGTTIHWAIPQVDAGSIILRHRFVPAFYLHPELLFIQSIKHSIASLIPLLGLLQKGYTLPQIDDPAPGRTYKGKEYTPEKKQAVKKILWRLFWRHRI